MKSCKISVIIPCFNVEKYIDRCIESVVRQTIGMDSLQIILVNDISSDKTLDKLLAWEKYDEQHILVIDSDEKMGCGGARNIGLLYAEGEYVFFLDADDWLEVDALEELYSCSNNGYYSYVSGKLILEKTDSFVDMQQVKSYETTNRKDFIYEALKQDDYYVWDNKSFNAGNVGGLPTSTGALYRRQMLTANDLFFPEKTDYEDNIWKAVLKLYCPNVYILDRVLYHYYYNGDSITQKRNNINFQDRLGNELRILEEYKQKGAFDIYKADLEHDFIKRFYLNTIFLIFTKYDYIPDIINYLRKTTVRLFPDYKMNYIYSELETRDLKLMKLLEQESDISENEMIEIRKEYLQSLEKV